MFSWPVAFALSITVAHSRSPDARPDACDLCRELGWESRCNMCHLDETGTTQASLSPSACPIELIHPPDGHTFEAPQGDELRIEYKVRWGAGVFVHGRAGMLVHGREGACM